LLLHAAVSAALFSALDGSYNTLCNMLSCSSGAIISQAGTVDPHTSYSTINQLFALALLLCLSAALFSALDGSSGLDSNARSALKRRLNPTVDLAAAAEDRLTADGYGIAHNSARSELVSRVHFFVC
jgi:hypothetical protein